MGLDLKYTVASNMTLAENMLGFDCFIGSRFSAKHKSTYIMQVICNFLLRFLIFFLIVVYHYYSASLKFPAYSFIVK